MQRQYGFAVGYGLGIQPALKIVLVMASFLVGNVHRSPNNRVKIALQAVFTKLGYQSDWFVLANYNFIN